MTTILYDGKKSVASDKRIQSGNFKIDNYTKYLKKKFNNK